MIPSTDTDDQNILKSDWTKGKAGQILQKVVVTDTFFFFKKIIKYPFKRKPTSHLTLSQNIDDLEFRQSPSDKVDYIKPKLVVSQPKRLRYELIPSRDNDAHRILQSDCVR